MTSISFMPTRLAQIAGLFGAILFSVLAFMTGANSAEAAICTFTGAVDNDWHTAGNWDCAAVPASADSAILPAGVSVSGTTALVNPADLDIGAGATLELVGQELSVASGSTVNAGTIQSNAEMTFQAVQNSGVIFGTGFQDVNFEGAVVNSGTIDTDTSGTRVIFSSSWDNTGGTFDPSFHLRFVGSTNQSVPANVTSVTGLSMQKAADSTLTLQANLQTTAGNSGVVLIGSGPATLDLGGFTITSQGNSLSLFGENNITNGTLVLNPLFGSVTATFSGQGDIGIDLTVDASGTVTFVGSPAGATFDMTGDLTVTSGTLTFTDASLSVGGNTVNGGTIHNNGALSFGGVTDNSGGGVIGNGGSSKITFMGLLDNSASSVVDAGTGGLEFYGNVDTSSGGSITNASTTRFLGASSASFTGGLNVVGSIALAKDAGTTLTIGSGDISTDGSLSISAGNTLALGTNDLTVDGSVTNEGLITRSGSSLFHPAESHAFTDSSGVMVSTVNIGGRAYVTLQDSNLNLDGTTAETVTITISGVDSETMTLTETGPATGIFRSAEGMEVTYSADARSGNGRIEIPSDTMLTSTYVDPYDGTETSAATVNASTTLAPAPTPSSGGTSGGGALPATTPPPAPVTEYQEIAYGPAPEEGITRGIAAHTLLKMPDDGNPDTQEDSVVYYIGTDGKRHAFTNEKVYLSWYESFNGVQLASREVLETIETGSNVTYKPGVKMVKFQNSASVYAVEAENVLRWVQTEEIAAALYGPDWSAKIDDIPSVFVSDYLFGRDIASALDYDPVLAEAGKTHPLIALAN